MGSLYLVRHAQASFGAANYDALSSLGHEQAALLAERLKRQALNIDKLIQGTMCRHAETASHYLNDLQYPPMLVSDARLNEFDHLAIMRVAERKFQDPVFEKGSFVQGSAAAKDFHRHFEKALQRWISGDFDGDYAESWLEFKRRCLSCVMDTVRLAEPQHNIMLFTSGGPISVIVQEALALTDAMTLKLNAAIMNGSLTRLTFKGDQIFLSFFNDSSHFQDGDGRLLTYR
ncbi:MAG: phosphoglycerate mutase family protein [Proteobacteria bacterium]|nr:phosphoglycerate mutase family protein [Pseudomonadota bacterium]